MPLLARSLSETPRALAALFVLLAAGCSSSKSSPSSGANDAAAPLGAGQQSIAYSMKLTVMPSSESFKCQYFRLPDNAAFVTAGRHSYTQGSHHLLLFRTDMTAIPAGQDAMQDCYEGAGAQNNVMGHVRGVVYGGQTPTGSKDFPQGIGLEMNAGEVVLMQAHYLNPTAQAIDAEVDVTLDVSDGTGITIHAGTLFYYDPFIDVPAGAHGARATMRCKVADHVTLIGANSHYHKRGYGYSAFLDDPSGAAAAAPFYTSQDWEHPGDLSAPVDVPAGSYLRFGCTYDNTNGATEYFQGPSANDNEMCMFIGTYYPRLADPSKEFCLPPDADGYGTGTVGCFSTLSCLNKCPPVTVNVTDGGFPLGDGTEVNSCVQKCFVASCPDASAKLFALQGCTDANCKTECASATSSACASCAQANCANETSDCFSDACAP